LRTILGIVKAVEVAREGRRGRVKPGVIESSSSSSESEDILYQVSSSSLVAMLRADSSESEESGGEESSDLPSDKSGKSYKPPKVAIINKRVKKRVSKEHYCTRVSGR
jgi:hypothetical protein